MQYQNQKKIKNNKNKGKSFGERNQESYGCGSTKTNQVHASSNIVLLEKDDIQRILEKKGLPCQAKLDKSHAGTTHVEKSLADHTDIDNMDENNKFICKTCSGREGFTYTYIHSNIHTYDNLCICVCACACMCICACVCIYACVCISTQHQCIELDIQWLQPHNNRYNTSVRLYLICNTIP